jgi:hypothetical protein
MIQFDAEVPVWLPVGLIEMTQLFSDEPVTNSIAAATEPRSAPYTLIPF